MLTSYLVLAVARGATYVSIFIFCSFNYGGFFFYALRVFELDEPEVTFPTGNLLNTSSRWLLFSSLFNFSWFYASIVD